MSREHQRLQSHGACPQVGSLALQAAAYEEVEAYPLEVLGAWQGYPHHVRAGPGTNADWVWKPSLTRTEPATHWLGRWRQTCL
jgi:hypothetical protein